MYKLECFNECNDEFCKKCKLLTSMTYVHYDEYEDKLETVPFCQYFKCILNITNNEVKRCNECLQQSVVLKKHFCFEGDSNYYCKKICLVSVNNGDSYCTDYFCTKYKKNLKTITNKPSKCDECLFK